METLLNIIYYIVPFFVLLGILVFVHEFGHFIIARWLGVTVTDFSIGFGKELWSRKDKHGTKWKISAIPLGGYCQFLGDADASSSTSTDISTLSETAQKGAFQLQKPWKKLAIVAAGPLFNYLFAILIFIGLFYSLGRMVFPSVVGGLVENGAAAEAGIEIGDIIRRVNGNETNDFNQISNEVMLADKDEITVDIERPLVLQINAAEINKLPQGDIPVRVNGQKITDWTELKTIVAANNRETLEVEIRRPLTINVVLRETAYEPQDGEKIKRRMLGVISSQEVTFAETDMSAGAAIKAGFKEAYDLTANTLRAVGQMITGQRGGKEVGGIIRIAEMSGDISKKGGLISFIYFMALLSVNLGLINLLPIPVLDGGNFIIFFIEMLTGRDLNTKIKDFIFKLGIIIILAIMVLATWNDVVHLISRWFD